HGSGTSGVGPVVAGHLPLLWGATARQCRADAPWHDTSCRGTRGKGDTAPGHQVWVRWLAGGQRSPITLTSASRVALLWGATARQCRAAAPWHDTSCRGTRGKGDTAPGHQVWVRWLPATCPFFGVPRHASAVPMRPGTTLRVVAPAVRATRLRDIRCGSGGWRVASDPP